MMKHWLSLIRTYLGNSRSLRNEELYKFNIYVIFNLLIIPVFLGFAFHHFMKAEYDESLRDGLTAAFLFVSLLLIFPIQRKIIIYLINVTDSGIGIASEKQEKIFLNFYQIQGGLRDKTPGVGLGLSITRRLVELHGGKIWVQSDGKGQGCQFSFSLPLIINNQQSTINSQQSK